MRDATGPVGSADVTPSSNVVLSVAASHNGRVNGKHWKGERAATKRTQMPKSLKTAFEKRREQDKAKAAVKAVEAEMRDEAKQDKER